MIPPKPGFTITASREVERRTVTASSPASALDTVEDFVAAGFKIESIFDEDGKGIDAMEVLQRLLVEER